MERNLSLIKITENEKGEPTVSCRELYEFLLELFKNKIPKEFFEARKNNKYFKKFDWNNCDNCIKN